MLNIESESTLVIFEVTATYKEDCKFNQQNKNFRKSKNSTVRL